MSINSLTLPYNITPSTLADANQVQANDAANRDKINEVITVVNNFPSTILNSKTAQNLIGGTIVPPFSAGQSITVGAVTDPVVITSGNSNVELLWKIKVGDNGFPTNSPVAAYGILADFTLERSNQANFSTVTIINPNADGYFREKLSLAAYNTAGVNTPIIDLPFLDKQLAIGTYYYRVKAKLKTYAGIDASVPSGATMSFESGQGCLITNITQN
jgi:hypothetical protein